MAYLILALLLMLGNIANAQVPGKVPDKFGKTYSDNAYVRFGNAEDAVCGYDTLQTNDALVCGLSTDSETFILMQKADIATDMGMSDLNIPNLVIAGSDPTNWVRIYHDGTNPVITTNTGSLVTPNLSLTSSLVFEGATADAFETTVSVTDPTADRSVVIPDAAGTVILSSLATNGADVANSVTGTSNGMLFEGATADAFETTLTVGDPTADRSIVLPDAAGTVILSNGAVDIANSIIGTNNGFIFEGTTADGFETTMSVVDPTADQTWSVPNFAVSAAFLGSTLTTNTVDAANSIWGVSNSLNFEGATADAFETTLTVADPTADRTVALPDATGTVILSSGAVDVANSITGTNNAFIFEGATADAFETTISVTDPTADRDVVVPNAGGTVVLAGNTSVAAGANTACNTTCGAATRCVGGWDAGVPTIVDCADATADKCFCSAN